MVDRAHALAAGVLIVVLVGALIFLGLWLSRRGEEHRPYLVISQSPISGLLPRSLVYFRGVQAGAVRKIEIDPHDSRNILVHIAVDKKIPITESTYATLRRHLVTGGATLELLDTLERPRPLATSGRAPGRIPLRESGFDRLTALADQLAGMLAQVGGGLQHLLTPQNRERLERLASDLAQFTGQLPTMARSFDQALKAIPALQQDASRALRDIRKLTADVQQLVVELRVPVQQTAQLAGAAQVLTKALVQRTLPQINSMLGQVSRSAEAVRLLAQRVRENPSSLIRGSSPSAPGPGERGYRGVRR